MLVSPANMLLLDEPTNHLDLRAKDVLLEAIANFTGTVLFVSHDRYFIDGLATRVFEVEDRRVHIYPGNYEDYLYRKAGGPEKTTASLTTFKPTSKSGAPGQVFSDLGSGTKSGAPGLASETWDVLPQISQESEPSKPTKRLNPIKQKQLEDRLTAVEQEIPTLESQIAAAEASLAHFTSAADSQRTAAQLDQLRTHRATLLAEWESLSLTLETQSTPA